MSTYAIFLKPELKFLMSAFISFTSDLILCYTRLIKEEISYNFKLFPTFLCGFNDQTLRVREFIANTQEFLFLNGE